MQEATAQEIPPEAGHEPPRSGIPPAGERIPGPKYRGGVTVTLTDGRDWVIPTLSLGQIHGPAVVVFSRVLKLMVALAEAKMPEHLVVKDITGGVIELLHLALARNYPQLHLTFDDVGELFDSTSATDGLKALYDLNGFVLEVLRRLGIASPQQATAAETLGKTD
jgi:hypothetical protein